MRGRAFPFRDNGVDGSGFSRKLEGELGYLLFLFCACGNGQHARSEQGNKTALALQEGSPWIG
jgi:hypothetical protein